MQKVCAALDFFAPFNVLLKNVIFAYLSEIYTKLSVPANFLK